MKKKKKEKKGNKRKYELVLGRKFHLHKPHTLWILQQEPRNPQDSLCSWIDQPQTDWYQEYNPSTYQHPDRMQEDVNQVERKEKKREKKRKEKKRKEKRKEKKRKEKKRKGEKKGNQTSFGENVPGSQSRQSPGGHKPTIQASHPEGGL